MQRIVYRVGLIGILALGATLMLGKVQPQNAEACGCLSPPAPALDDEEFAVNQQAEQIIFEVEEGFVTAHVMIRYAGHPEQFAWLVPVPAVPELSLSPAAGFGLLDSATAPDILVSQKDICPVSQWQCSFADMPSCEDPRAGNAQDASAASQDAGDGSAPPVEVLDRQVVGSYETITFAAGDTAAAVQWLRTEGFIVNETMAPYMQPYADAGMLFLASKLVAGADVSQIKPLKMRFPAPNPMIPLQLTAVAADPHMTITAYVYGDAFFAPEGHTLVEIDPTWLSEDADGRSNYPMVLARAIDEAGGDGFVAEYRGDPAIVDFDQGTGCCSSNSDICGIEFDGICSCPGNEFDALDCEGYEELVEGADFVNALAQKYGSLTRLTTRMSPEDMTYDPVFVPSPNASAMGTLRLRNEVNSLRNCEAAILDSTHYSEVMEQEACATTYCGTGTCVLTGAGAACDCDEGSTGKQFTDLDGKLSVTCVPNVAPVDLGAGGQALPNTCAGINCGLGTCLAVGGFPTCECDPGAAVGLFLPKYPTCRPIVAQTLGSGARDYSGPLEDIPVCEPMPPTCGEYGWLEARQGNVDTGVACVSSMPSVEDLVPVDSPTCEELGYPRRGCGCASSGGGGLGGLWALGLVLGVMLFRRRRSC